MAKEIVNRIANSKLVTFNLEDLYPKGPRTVIDIASWLEEGFILRESSFRESVKNHSWQNYQGHFVALTCSTDAIVPAWAFMLVSTYLNGIAQKTVVGSLEVLETVLYTEIIQNLDIRAYQNVPVIVKGCSDKPVPQNAYVLLIEKLQPVVRSLMFGEACSSVPLYKKRK